MRSACRHEVLQRFKEKVTQRNLGRLRTGNSSAPASFDRDAFQGPLFTPPVDGPRHVRVELVIHVKPGAFFVCAEDADLNHQYSLKRKLFRRHGTGGRARRSVRPSSVITQERQKRCQSDDGDNAGSDAREARCIRNLLSQDPVYLLNPRTMTPAPTTKIPSHSLGLGRSPRKTNAKRTTSTRLNLSTGATFEASPAFSALK